MVLIISKNKSVYVFQNVVYLLKTFWVSQLYTATCKKPQASDYQGKHKPFENHFEEWLIWSENIISNIIEYILFKCYRPLRLQSR